MNTLDQQSVTLCKRRLRARASELRAEIRTTLQRSAEESHARIAELARDVEDDAFSNLIVDLNHAEIQRDAAELGRIDRALLRLADGSYGTCQDCGGPIASERLQVEPTAARCIRCQEMYEKTHLTSPTPTL